MPVSFLTDKKRERLQCFLAEISLNVVFFPLLPEGHECRYYPIMKDRMNIQITFTAPDLITDVYVPCYAFAVWDFKKNCFFRLLRWVFSIFFTVYLNPFTKWFVEKYSIPCCYCNLTFRVS
jgi:hypothetical protein